MSDKKTMAEDFFEKFPNAVLSDEYDGEIPATCAAYLYGKDKVRCTINKSCADCWQEDVPDENN